MRGKKWGSRFAMLAIAGLAATACGGEEEAADQAPVEEPTAGAPAGEPAAPAGEIPAELQGVVTAEEVSMGKQIFSGKGNCMTCHGPDATGTSLAPNLTDDEWLWTTAAAEPQALKDELIAQIHQGVPQPKQFPAPMPAMGGGQLTDQEVQALAAYILTL